MVSYLSENIDVKWHHHLDFNNAGIIFQVGKSVYNISIWLCSDRSDLFARMSEKKAVIKNADMSEDMQSDVVECATQALEKYNIEKDIAAYIKKEFDKKYR